MIFHTALDMTTVLRQLASEGWDITPEALTALSPYITEKIKRFGEYATDGLTDPPAAFNPRLDAATGFIPARRTYPADCFLPRRTGGGAVSDAGG